MHNTINTIGYNKFYQDFVAESGSAQQFLHPVHNIDWRKYTADIIPVTNEQIQAKRILKNQNSDLYSDKSLKYLEYLDNPDSVIIITGQQLGLFGSPMYTIYKAITVLKLVEELNANNSDSKNYIPVFWLESEDHDFKEINHFGIWDKSLNPVKMSYEGNDFNKKSIRHYRFEDSISKLISDMMQKSIDSEFSEQILELISKSFAPHESWVAGSRSFLKSIFHESGLLFFEPGTEDVKQLSVSFFTDFIIRTEQVTEAFTSTTESLLKEGYDSQVPPISGKTYVHLEDEHLQRFHLYYSEHEYYSKDSNLRLSRDEIKDYLQLNAQKISTSVISRTLLQSWLLPVAAYVAGPAEIAYWSQLAGLFREFSIQMPVVYPRMSVTLIEPKIKRFIEKYDIDLTNIARKKHDFVKTFFSESNLTKENPFTEFQSSIKNEGKKIASFLNKIDPTLVNSSDKLVERIQSQIENLENKSLQALQRKEQTVTAHLEQIHRSVFPEGVPQERYASIVYFLNKFGPGFVEDLITKMDLKTFDHQVIYI